MDAMSSMIREHRERIHERARELFYEELEQIPRGVPVPAKEHYQKCRERAQREIVGEIEE